MFGIEKIRSLCGMKKKNKLAVITVCYNSGSQMLRTLKSISSQKNKDFDYFVVDGGSTDDTIGFIRSYCDVITSYISEADGGVYDAMNKGLGLTDSEWVLFMNAGDVFYSEYTVGLILNEIVKMDEYKFMYSNVVLCGDDGDISEVKCDHKRKIVNHQCSVYRRDLHQVYGNYLNYRDITISDYIFFNLIPNKYYKKVGFVIAKYNINGISQGKESRRQKFAVDYLFGRVGLVDLVFRILFYDIYLKIKMLLSI